MWPTDVVFTKRVLSAAPVLLHLGVGLHLDFKRLLTSSHEYRLTREVWNLNH